MGQQYFSLKTYSVLLSFFVIFPADGKWPTSFFHLAVWLFRNEVKKKETNEYFVFSKMATRVLFCSLAVEFPYSFVCRHVVIHDRHKQKNLSSIRKKIPTGGGKMLISFKAGFPSFRMPSIQVPLPKHTC